ncbi:MAG: type II toxin-antitoxin system VapC family toxin [bacterium]
MIKNISIDTNIYTAFKMSDPEVIDTLSSYDHIGLDITVIAELLSGFKGGKKDQKNRDELKQFINNPRVVILNHDLETAEYYSVIYLNLKSRGKPIPTNDIWIAANALRHNYALCTKDKHFQFIESLILI